VRLPRREGQGRLGELYEQAKRRFHRLERRFQEHPDLHQAYSEFMQEYKELGHMNQINEDTSSTEERYYLPHHAIFKSSSSTTRTHIVFGGSCRSSNGLSLNDTLLVGPTLGWLWHPLSDQFLISKGTFAQGLRESKNSPVNKHIISSIAATIFDPLGLISPVVVVYKIFLQQLWLHKLD